MTQRVENALKLFQQRLTRKSENQVKIVIHIKFFSSTNLDWISIREELQRKSSFKLNYKRNQYIKYTFQRSFDIASHLIYFLIIFQVIFLLFVPMKNQQSSIHPCWIGKFHRKGEELLILFMSIYSSINKQFWFIFMFIWVEVIPLSVDCESITTIVTYCHHVGKQLIFLRDARYFFNNLCEWCPKDMTYSFFIESYLL